MKQSPDQKLFDAITDLSDEHIEEAGKAKLTPRIRIRRRILALAACAALILGILLFIPRETLSPAGTLTDVIFPQAYAFDDTEARREILAENPVEDSFLSSIRDFSYETISCLLSDTEENSNYSPISLYYALALAASGAQNGTWEELSALLHVSDPETLAAQCANLYRQLYTDNEVGQLKIANSLWMDYHVSWKDSFIDRAAAQFFASSHSVDFKDEATARDMAQWVAKQTNQTLLPEFSFSDNQILSILNTIYFRDEWSTQFAEASTGKDTFYLSDGSTVSCDFMNRRDETSSFYRGEDFLRASLAFKNRGEMVFILPDEGTSLHDLLSSPEQIRSIFEGGEETQGSITWKIPKFSFDSDYDLVEPLKELGLSSVFSEDADFSGITDNSAYFSLIRQQTHIAIDENGAEASAFTEIAFEGTRWAQEKEDAEMILNRPFLYGITAPNGTLLFAGICANPISG